MTRAKTRRPLRLHLIFAISIGLSPLAISNSASGASDRCPSFFESLETKRSAQVRHPEIRLLGIKGVALSTQQEHALLSLFDGLAELTQGKLLLPQNLRVEIGPPDDWAQHLSETISAPLDYRAVGYRKHPKTTETVISHEWGHALFKANVASRFPVIAKAMKKEEPDLMELRAILSPYDEFFADLIAVMHARDGKAIRDVLFSASSKNPSNEAALYRDFTAKHQPEGWSLEGLYTVLSPVRSFIWEAYLSRPKAQANSGLILDAALEAIGNEAIFCLNRPDLHLSPAEVNQRLIRELKLRLQARGFDS